MHHLTTLNLPTPQARDADRAWLASAQARFLAAGGVVEQAEPAQPSRPIEAHWRNNPIQLPGTPQRRELERAEHRLAERIRALAWLGMASESIRKRVKLGHVAFYQLTARHGIRLPATRSTTE